MSRIRGKHTEPERVLRSLLWAEGLRYRVHARTPVGRPDLVFPGPMVAVFVDGCFWHGCPDHYVRPRSTTRLWADKLAANTQRDVVQTRRLGTLGWRVCRIWEHEIFEKPEKVVAEIRKAVHGLQWSPAPSWRVIKVVEVEGDADHERRFLWDIWDPSQATTQLRRRTTKKWHRAPSLPQSRGTTR